MEETGADFARGPHPPALGAPPPDWVSPALYGVLAIPDNGPDRVRDPEGMNEHVMAIGANMAVRREVVDRLGGWRRNWASCARPCEAARTTSSTCGCWVPA